MAKCLRSAYEQGPIEPISGKDAADVTSAYRIQNINTEYALTVQGRRLIGRKIGLTSLAVQRQLGVDQPDYGMLFADMEIQNGVTGSMQRFLQPKIEAEIAFGFRRDVTDASITMPELVDAIEWVAPALEVVDSRIADWRINVVDTVADNASSGAFVIGRRQEFSPTVDVVNCEMRLYEENKLVSQGKGSDCLGNPLIATLWLARKMLEVGRPIRVGDVVMSGALGPMVRVRAGARYRAVVDGFCDVSIAFEAGHTDIKLV
ncbi:2-keto-4-pentenoate hydratase [Cupriavidus basilensis]